MLFAPGAKRIPPLQGKSRRRETVELKHVHVVIMFAEGCVYWNVWEFCCRSTHGPNPTGLNRLTDLLDFGFSFLFLSKA